MEAGVCVGCGPARQLGSPVHQPPALCVLELNVSDPGKGGGTGQECFPKPAVGLAPEVT